MNKSIADAMTPGQTEFARRASDFGLQCWHVDPAAALPVERALDKAARTVAAACLATDEPTLDASIHDLLALPWSPGAMVVDLIGCGIDREQVIRILRHYHADLRRADTDAKSIDGFSQQLSQSYEEVNLIYRMAKLMTSAAEPADVVQSMCDELRGTLNYGWLAMTFRDGHAVLPPLRQTLRHSGNIPGEREQFLADCRATDNAEAGTVLLPGSHPLATRTGTEVLTEAVMQDDLPIGTLIAGDRRGHESDVTSSEIQLVRAAAGFLGLFHQNAYRFAEQRRQFFGTLQTLSAAVDAKDPYTRGHSDRVALLGYQLAKAIGFDDEAAEGVRVAGLLHDIGKIGIPESVLCKPARLTDEEFAIIKRHPTIGYEILKSIPSLDYHLPGVLHHHERWDGRGYPHKLAGEQIPMIARILAFADTFDAMSSSRAYRKGMERAHVLGEIRKSSGTQLDPQLIEPFVTMDFTAFDQMLANEIQQQQIVSEAKAA